MKDKDKKEARQKPVMKELSAKELCRVTAGLAICDACASCDSSCAC